MRAFFILFALFCVTSYAAPLPDSLLDKNVTFTIPAKWTVQQQFSKGSAQVLQILIPDPDTDDTPDSSNAILTAEPLQPGVDVERFGDSRLQHVAIVTDIPAGHTWRTVLSRADQENTPYIICDRFGVDAGYMVALRVAFPIIQRKDADWIARTVAACNAFVGSLKIRGKNVITSELKDEKGVIWLRDLKDPAKTFRGPNDEVKFYRLKEKQPKP
jgi:hypothetical protein